MIPDHEITKCPEHEVKSKIGNIFVNEEILEEYSVKIYEIDSYFYEHYNKKYNLTIIVKNTNYLKLIFIFLSILQQQKLMKKVILTETLSWKKKDKKHQRKDSAANLLELILVKKIMMQTMKLVEYRCLPVSFKTKKRK